MRRCFQVPLAVLLLTGFSQAKAGDAEYAFRWSPDEGGPTSISSVLSELALKADKTKRLTVQYFEVPQPSGFPSGYRAIGRERWEEGEKPEAMYKLRGPEPAPSASLLKCPLKGDAESKLEVDVTLQSAGQVKRSISASCTVEDMRLPEALPMAGVVAKGCTSKVERVKAKGSGEKLTLEHWALSSKKTYIEVSMKGPDAPEGLSAFNHVVSKLISLGAKPIDAGKTELAGNCEHDDAAPVIATPKKAAGTQKCEGSPVAGIPGWTSGWKLTTGGYGGFAKLNINIDGYGRAYHRKNAEAGALIHLCNAGRVYLPNGTSYEGSSSNATCTGRFMNDLARIEAAGWKDPKVGAIDWYGIVGQGSATIGGKHLTSPEPVLQKDGSGFYVSPTSLVDKSISDVRDQSRYVNALRIPAGVIPKALREKSITYGSFGVAYRLDKRIPVPFVVGDGGPRVGEGSTALARLAAGLEVTDDITRKNRYEGQREAKDVLWIFFGGDALAFDGKNEAATLEAARQAFENWGGVPRLEACSNVVPK